MDLLVRVGIAAIVLIALIGALFLFKSISVPQYSESQAVSIVMSKLNNTFPGASISIINVSRENLSAGIGQQRQSWYIVASIVENATRACPALSIESFSYPGSGLLPTIINNYTSLNCTISGLASAPYYIINSPYVAQVKSYTSGYYPIVAYVDKYGYANTDVSARYMPELSNRNFTALNRTFSNVWLVLYSASHSNFSLYVVMSNTGGIIYSFNQSK
ncbi:MAG: hypothetical protein M1360_00075 [Candidatus Marsarchaeota archaeon]|jgi:hypothetical protein|nr:hypothetical protein [Candidatus Marsarchaeota archaeon]MCL5418325.1 hypothetical protein [Candidatus Marsarchaeota archaeon]